MLHSRDPSRECPRCHRIMTLTSFSPYTRLPNVDIAQFDCACGYLLALPVAQKE